MLHRLFLTGALCGGSHPQTPLMQVAKPPASSGSSTKTLRLSFKISVAISVRNSEFLFDCQTIRLPCTTIYSTYERSWRLLSFASTGVHSSGFFFSFWATHCLCITTQSCVKSAFGVQHRRIGNDTKTIRLSDSVSFLMYGNGVGFFAGKWKALRDSLSSDWGQIMDSLENEGFDHGHRRAL